MSRPIITGAGGFVATALRAELAARGMTWTALHRAQGPVPEAGERLVPTADYLDPAALSTCGLDGATVIHLAAIAHTRGASRSRIMAANASLPVRLAESARECGARRFIFLSSAKVHGEIGVYGEAKRRAERGLERVGERTGLEVVVLRPAPVYGHGMRGNLAVLTRWVRRGIPLPLAGLTARRSFLDLSALVDLIIRCIDAESVAGESLDAADARSLGIPEVLEAIGEGCGRPARTFPLGRWSWRALAVLPGLRSLVEPLTRSLELDASRAAGLTGWVPQADPRSALAGVIAGSAPA